MSIRGEPIVVRPLQPVGASTFCRPGWHMRNFVYACGAELAADGLFAGSFPCPMRYLWQYCPAQSERRPSAPLLNRVAGHLCFKGSTSVGFEFVPPNSRPNRFPVYAITDALAPCFQCDHASLSVPPCRYKFRHCCAQLTLL